ncbi:hypothetical protein Gasu2_12300 [Galdieria sulphuraria]|nr:hypothetical protein Gasu2_12300 [Galdieria sulphuraria]
MHQDNTQDQLRRDLLQSVEKTRSYLAALLESTSKSLYLASKRSLNNTSSSGIPPNLVDQLVRSFVQASQLAEQYQRRIEQRDLEDSTLCQQLSERLNRLSQQIWERENKLDHGLLDLDKIQVLLYES